MAPKFGLQAARYRRFRPGYPAWLFDRAAEACGDHRALALDLGAGSGQATADILARFERVAAVEPDPDMAALIPPDPRLTVRIGGAEDLSALSGVDAAFSATAFHWMDHRAVGAALAQALRPGGVFLCFGYGPFEVMGPDAARALVEAEWRLWDRHVDTRLSVWRPYPELLHEAGVFSSIEDIGFAFNRESSPEDAAGLFLTTSYAAAHARETGDEEGYCEDFIARMVEATGGEPVTTGFVVTGGLARL
ncbi:MAG: class I SAM-dependent methyltransferase [Caulobacteraceae bacterium]